MQILLAIYLSRRSRSGKRELVYTLYEFERCRLGLEACPPASETRCGLHRQNCNEAKSLSTNDQGSQASPRLCLLTFRPIEAIEV